MICEFGYEKRKNGHEICKLFVSIKKPEHEIYVNHYLRTYLPDASNIEIVEFKEIQIAVNMALKSGDTVDQNSSYGTVGLCLTDGSHYFCATCKHVVNISNINNANVIIRNSQGEAFATDNLLVPSNDLDFMAIRLTNQSTPIQKGLKNQFSRFVRGIIFGNDMMLPHKHHVYKWGASSRLTNGNFSRIREGRNLFATVEIECFENTSFTLPGDSGSLICYSADGFEFAAFILIGHAMNDDTLIYGYKLEDAMKECRKYIHPNITALV